MAHGRVVLGRRSGTHAASAFTVTSCGTEITAPGTYTVTANLDGASAPQDYCIWIDASDVTLNLEGHSLTNSDVNVTYGVYVGGSNVSVQSDTVTDGTISGFEYGAYLYSTTRTTLSSLSVLMGTSSATSEDAVYAEYAAHASITRDTISLGGTSADAVYLEYGSGNVVSSTTASQDSSGDSDMFETYYEYEDTFSGNTAECTSGGAVTVDCSGMGFYEEYSNRDDFAANKSYGLEYGLYLYEDGYGDVQASGNYVSDYAAGSAYGYYGIYDYEAYDDYSFLYQKTRIASNTVVGYEYGYHDYYSLDATLTYNTSQYAYEYGFYLKDPAGYSITDNTATGTNTAGVFSSDSDGFYFDGVYPYYAPVAFNYNKSNGNYYGFYSNEDAVHGTGNSGVNDEYLTWNVEV